MARYETSFVVPAAPAKAFAYAADYANAPAWDRSVVEAARLDDGPLCVGSSFRLLVAFYGRRIELIYAIAAYEPDRRLALVAENKSVRASDTFTIEAHEEGSRLGYVAERQLMGALRVFDRGLQVAFGGLGDRAAAGLRDALGG